MNKCPNCFENHSNRNFENYCDPCYDEIYLSSGTDPNTDDDVMIIKSTNLTNAKKENGITVG